MKIQRIIFLLTGLLLFSALVHAADWQTDFDRALITATKTKKPILINFTGSDWCPPCIAMHKRVLSKPAFLEFAEKNLILMEVDSPRHKELPPEKMEQTVRLRRQFQIESLPTLVLISGDGKVLGQMEGYAGEGPADVISWIEKVAGKPQ